mgnify:CR=1 FL=1
MIGDWCASLVHEEFGKATCNESLVSISRLGKLISTRYSTYSSTMGFFGLKTAKISDFCHFPKKKLNLEVFLPKFRDLCHEKRKGVPKALKGWYWHAGITGISHSTMALMKNGFFGFFRS